jgi:Family of unknown function (DUF6163)
MLARLRAFRRPLDILRDRAQEPITEPPARLSIRWSPILVWFMRLVALLWIVKGLLSWAVIVGLSQAGMPFEARSTGFQATIIWFALIDLVAAVGLWLNSSWGGVLWLLAVMSHLILAVFFPRIVAGGPVLVALSLALIGVYLAVSWLAAGEERT